MGQLVDKRRYRKSAAQAAPALDWLKFTARTAGTFTLTIPANLGTSYITSISYSTNNGVTWTTINNSSSEVVITTPTIQAGSSVFWKGITNAFAAYVNGWNYTTFSSAVNFDVSGNIMSLLYGDNFEGKLSLETNAFRGLFRNAKIVHAKNMLLPATTLADYCYSYMFYGCTSLVTAPALPATTLADYCYSYMFYGCTSLTSSISLPAQTMVDSCYANMFRGCTHITYAEMFAVTLATMCFNSMFYGCSNLSTVYVKTITTAINATNYTSQTYTNLWLYNVKLTGVIYAPKVWRTDLMKGRANGIPTGWTVNY